MFDGRRFEILTICTGNVCRSPLAERALQAGFDHYSPDAFRVQSAGTRALVGRAVPPEISAIAGQIGVDVGEFYSRQLATDMLGTADLILTLTRKHSADVLSENPLFLKKTFTLREFARVLPSVPANTELDSAERWRVAVKHSLRDRSVGYLGPKFDDVIDPYRQSSVVFRQMADELIPAVKAIVGWEAAAKGIIL